MDYDQSSVMREKNLLDVSKDIFGSILTTEEIEKSFKPDGQFVEGFPLSAQRFIWQARERFFKAENDNFHITIDLSRNHHIDESAGLSKEDMKIIKPYFANAYLDHVGVTNTEESLRRVQRMMPIKSENVQIRTKKNGYLKEQIIIKQNPSAVYANTAHKEDHSMAKCSQIRQNLQIAWTSLERSFPRSDPPVTPKVFLPPSSIKTIGIIEDNCKIPLRCPSSIKKGQLRSQKKKISSPFIKIWPLVLLKHDIERIVLEFCSQFDFSHHFKWKQSQIDSCIEVLKYSLIHRLIYHCIKYCHSVFVLVQDDISNFIRMRANWFIVSNKYNDINGQNFLPVILILLKLCTITVFTHESNDANIKPLDLAEESIFLLIDKCLNPHMIYSSLSVPSRTSIDSSHKRYTKIARLNNDIYQLLSTGKMSQDDENIASLFFKDNPLDQIIPVLIAEQWGDLNVEGEEKPKLETDNPHRLSIQKMINQDIADVNSRVPNKVPIWIKRKPN